MYDNRIMDPSQDLRHNFITPTNDFASLRNPKIKRANLFAIFFIQFLLSQLVLSYGMYALYFLNKNNSLIEAILPPLLFLLSSKLFSPSLNKISNVYNEQYFRSIFVIGSFICSISITICYFFTEHIILRSVCYGLFGGFGTTLMLSLVNSYLEDMYPYQAQMVDGINHLGIALGLFATPHLLQMLFDFFGSIAFVIHGAILLHTLPAGLLLGRKSRKLTSYFNFASTNNNCGQEMIEMSCNNNLSFVSRSWKCPSDRINYDDNDEFDLDDVDGRPNSKAISSPKLEHRINAINVTILPQIEEEDENEDEEDEDGNVSKRSSMLLNNNLKRMSVISTKLEELITKDEEEVILDINQLKPPGEEIKSEIKNVNDVMNNNDATSLEQNNNFEKTANISNSSCCNPYQKYMHRTRCKRCLTFLYNLTLRSTLKSLKLIEFYPCLLTNIHSMLSPLIFLNFVAFKLYFNSKEINLTELTFLYSVVAFAYLIFLMILPWISEISKRNMKYVYITGCLVSAIGINLCVRTQKEDYILVSCLLYGFGYGIETYTKNIIMKEALGVQNWIRTEATLEILSGILLTVIIFTLDYLISNENTSDLLYYSELWLDVIFSSHLIVFSIWIIFPAITYLFTHVLFKHRGTYNA